MAQLLQHLLLLRFLVLLDTVLLSTSVHHCEGARRLFTFGMGGTGAAKELRQESMHPRA
jgi:hypothetical protein